MINTALAKRRRAELGLTLEEVSARVGVYRQSIHDWETGKHEPNLKRLRAYAEVLGVSVEDLARDPDAEVPAT